MGALSFLFNHGLKSKIGEIIVDAVLQESHERSAKISEHPVENGETLSDHVQNSPVSLKIQGIISNTPLSFLGVPLIKGGNARNEAVETLEQLFADRKPFTVVTSLKAYNNMVLEQLSFDCSSRTQDSLRFSCKAKQIKVVGEKRIFIPSPKKQRYQKKKHLGKQTTKPLPQTQQKSASLLSTLFGAGS